MSNKAKFQNDVVSNFDLLQFGYNPYGGVAERDAETAEVVQRLGEALASSVFKKLVNTAGTEQLIRLRASLQRDIKTLKRLERVNNDSVTISYNSDGDKVVTVNNRIITDSKILLPLSDSYDLVNFAVSKILEETEREEYNYDLEETQERTVLSKRIYVTDDYDLDRMTETKEKSPISIIYNAMRKYVMNQRHIEAGSKYCYFSEMVNVDGKEEDVYKRFKRDWQIADTVDITGKTKVQLSASVTEHTMNVIVGHIADMKLTARQAQILNYRLAGFSDVAIANTLGVSKQAVNKQRQAIGKKLAQTDFYCDLPYESIMKIAQFEQERQRGRKIAEAVQAVDLPKLASADIAGYTIKLRDKEEKRQRQQRAEKTEQAQAEADKRRKEIQAGRDRAEAQRQRQRRRDGEKARKLYDMNIERRQAEAQAEAERRQREAEYTPVVVYLLDRGRRTEAQRLHKRQNLKNWVTWTDYKAEREAQRQAEAERREAERRQAEAEAQAQRLEKMREENRRYREKQAQKQAEAEHTARRNERRRAKKQSAEQKRRRKEAERIQSKIREHAERRAQREEAERREQAERIAQRESIDWKKRQEDKRTTAQRVAEYNAFIES